MIQFEKSRPIIVSPYQPRWVDEFQEIGGRLRQVLADTAVRIDHIGSTSIPDLPAKDIIDIQITVADLDDPAVVEKLARSGYQLRPEYGRDEYIGIPDPDSPELRKRLCREPEGSRRSHIHIRQDGRFNQRYPLLFRDYLRTHPIMRDGYALIKMRLAEIFPDSVDGYLYIKDPLMDMLFAAAQEWAQATGWQPDEGHL
ncbi:MAG TPA: GrpB family protein [Chloroflexota bacterium]|nr:GrpB family protein [Chloroflexota bacterium]